MKGEKLDLITMTEEQFLAYLAGSRITAKK